MVKPGHCSIGPISSSSGRVVRWRRRRRIRPRQGDVIGSPVVPVDAGEAVDVAAGVVDVFFARRDPAKDVAVGAALGQTWARLAVFSCRPDVDLKKNEH